MQDNQKVHLSMFCDGLFSYAIMLTEYRNHWQRLTWSRFIQIPTKNIYISGSEFLEVVKTFCDHCVSVDPADVTCLVLSLQSHQYNHLSAVHSIWCPPPQFAYMYIVCVCVRLFVCVAWSWLKRTPAEKDFTHLQTESEIRERERARAHTNTQTLAKTCILSDVFQLLAAVTWGALGISLLFLFFQSVFWKSKPCTNIPSVDATFGL